MPRTTHTAVFSHIILAPWIFWSLLGLCRSDESSIAHESVAVVVEGAVWSLEVAVWFFKFWFHLCFFAGERQTDFFDRSHCLLCRVLERLERRERGLCQ